MKALMITASAAAMTFAASAAGAQEGGMYGSVGYAATDRDDANLSAIQGRFGVRLHPNIAIEGEGAIGIGDEDIGDDTTVKLDHQLAAYGVGFVPLTPQFEVLGRLGYGNTRSASTVRWVKATPTPTRGITAPARSSGSLATTPSAPTGRGTTSTRTRTTPTSTSGRSPTSAASSG